MQTIEVHSQVDSFTLMSFERNIDGMLGVLNSLTKRSDVLTSSMRQQLNETETELQSLTFLALLSAPYLAQANGSPEKEIFFQLLHGVRAHLRLLQWEQSAAKLIPISLLPSTFRMEMAYSRQRTPVADCEQLILPLEVAP